MNPFVRSAAIFGVGVLFVLAVLSSTQNLTVGLVQSALLLALALIAVRVFRNDREGQLKAALICVLAGLVLRPWHNPYAAILSDSLIALAVTVVAVYLIGPPLVRLAIASRLRVGDAVHAFTSARTAVPGESVEAKAGARTALTQWVPLLTALALAVIVVLASPRLLVGTQSATLHWNAHVFTSNLVRSGAHLRDPSLALSGASGVFVAVSDSLVLTTLKLIDPHAWATWVWNLVTLLGFGLFVFASVRFLQRLSFGWAESVAATVLFLLLPIGAQLRFAAPLDLSVPLLALLPVLSGRVRVPAFLIAAFATGLCNTADGYEYAALIIVVRSFNIAAPQIPAAIYAWAAALGILGSLVASWLLRALAPAASLREAWWYAQEIPRIVWAENLPIWWLAIVAFALLAGAGIYALVRTRAFALLRCALALAFGAAILALPTRLGGIPLISLAHVLQVIAPQGWPTARFLELAAFALTIPVACAACVALTALEGRQRAAVRAIVWISAAILFAFCLPRAVPTVLENVAAGTPVVQFPIAEAGSRAGILYAEELLGARARILQPLIFVDTPSALDLYSSPDDPAAVRAMRDARVRIVMVRSDIYAQPSWRTVEPRLYDPAFSAEPSLSGAYPWKIITYAPAGQGT